ncbi:Crp/Fnr family transcriptional regulator [Pedobacter cryoconitis]|uniref:Crp/Fnr family transcriptional regulator n=1 Tax=Pedobacter cryoconitis TaxID=188932 RepID=UPI0016143C57|nr:Crp/Fnr family transcriptional regulator [Pedobacter cryoconitis]MBB5643936.1 CRP-like cAMP-binding protein [Pedobacter cryoconitis]
MEDIAPFIENVSKKIQLSPENLERLLAAFKLIRVSKKQFVIQPGFIAKHRMYILKGAFRSYVIDEKGNDHTIQFAIEDWWISDYNSYIYQSPATQFVVALEDSFVLQIDYDTEQQLKTSSHELETLFRIMAEKSAAFYARRVTANLTQNAEQRYNEFVEKFPKVAQRLPQYALASYLNMTREFLSRIRNDKVRKKVN